jgi:tRNA-modifying protein YgfZ
VHFQIESSGGGRLGAMKAFLQLEQGVLCFRGSDRIAFLHGQCTNDVRGLSVSANARALILNAKGQIEFDIEVLRRADDLLVFCEAGLETALFERFKRYIIFDDVQMTLATADWSLWHVVGEFQTSALHWVANRGFGLGINVLFAKTQLPNWDGTQLENPELARVKAGLPNAHSDAFLGLLPQECGLESAVSYKKGCYIGQEIMARLEARGNTRYEMRQVQLPKAVARGTKVLLGSREVGQLGAVVQNEDVFTALAVLRKDLEPNAVLQADSVVLQFGL